MATRAEVRARMLELGGADLGRTLGNVAPATATTMTVDALKLGGDAGTGYLSGVYLFRPRTLPGDAARLVTNYEADDGTLEVDANWMDTDTRDAELWRFPPRLAHEAIDEALRELRRLAAWETGLPGNGAVLRVPPNVIPSERSIERVERVESRIVTGNRDFSHRDAYDVDGMLTPAGFTLVNDWSWTTGWRGADGLRASGGAGLILPAPVQYGRAEEDAPPLTLTLAVLAKASAPTTLRLRLGDADEALTLDAGGWERHELTADVPRLDVGSARLDVGSAGGVSVSMMFLVYGEGGAGEHWRDGGERACEQLRWTVADQYDGFGLRVDDWRGEGARLRVWYAAPFPAFGPHATDDWRTEAPLEQIAIGALAKLYSRMAMEEGGDMTRLRELAAKWRRDWGRILYHSRSKKELPLAMRLGRRY